jgi:hypothetical protein
MRPSLRHGLALALGAILLPTGACVVRDRTCASATECAQRFGDGLSCVAGRCVEDARDGGAKRQPAILASTTRRFVARPTDLAYLASGMDPARVPPAIVLGKNDAKLLLRFDVPLAQEEDVVEAYLLVDRLDVLDTDPNPISLHVERVLDRWDGRSITWAAQPRIEDDRGAATIVTVGARPVVRLDVTPFVQRWKRHDPSDQGLAIVAGSTNASGMAFATVDGSETDGLRSDPSDPSKPLWLPSAPRLEIYVQRPLNAGPSLPSNVSAVGSTPAPPSASSSTRAGPTPR